MIRFTAEDGSFVEFPVGGEAQDSGDKATNKAASAALKYAIMQTFLIPTAEVKDSEADPEEPAAPLAPPRPPVAPREEPLDLHAAATPAALPLATAAEVGRCREAIATAPDPSVPFDALLARRQVSHAAHATLTAALRARLAPPAPEPTPEDLADRPALQPPRPARGGRTPSIF